MSDSDIKGTAILARLSYLDAQPSGRAPVMARLTAADRQVIDSVVASGKYPLALKARLDNEIAAVLRPNDPIGMFYELGRWSAKHNFELFHSSFIKARDPQGFMANAPAMRRMYYADDQARYERTGDNSCALIVAGATAVEAPDCYGTAGYWEYALGLAGAKNARVEHARCIARGDGVCEFRCRWD